MDLGDAGLLQLLRRGGWPVLQGCIQQTAFGHFCTPLEFSSKRCREATGEEEDHREVKSAHPQLREEAAAAAAGIRCRRSHVNGSDAQVLLRTG